MAAACSTVNGAAVISADGLYLGRLVAATEPDSIYDRFGPFGDRASKTSIWNEFGQGGGAAGLNSAFSPYALRPPRLVRNRMVLGYLSTNRQLAGAVDPILIGMLCFGYHPR